MIDDSLEWLTVVALDDDEPTIPDVQAWSELDAHDDETLRALAVEDDADYTLDLGIE